MTRRLNFKCSKSKTLFTSAAIAMILTSISAQEVQAAEEIYYDEATTEAAVESAEVVEQGTLDTSISSDEGRAVEDTLVNVQVDTLNQNSEDPIEFLIGNEVVGEVFAEVEETAAVQAVVEAQEVAARSVDTEEEIVYFEDEVLEASVKRELGLKYTDEITILDLHSLERLVQYDDASRVISNLTGLEEAKNLRYLDLWNNNISDLSPLSNLHSLNHIYLPGNQITDLTSLSNLSSLYILELSDNNITDVSALSNLPSLRELYLDDNQINDISGLLNMPSLERLSLSNNNITDISGLSDLPSLRELYLADNQISDISHLEKLTSLKRLTLNNNNIEDISVLENFSALQSVSLFDNNISDISVLPHLNLGRELDLSNNKIIDITPLESLGFTERLNLSNNDITTINSLKKLEYIEYLDLSNNNVSDLEVLLDLPFLRSVNLENNNIIDDKQTIIALVNREVAIQHNSIKEDHQYERTEIPSKIIYVENPNIFIGREVVSQYGEYGYHQLVEIVTTFDGEKINPTRCSDVNRSRRYRFIQRKCDSGRDSGGTGHSPGRKQPFPYAQKTSRHEKPPFEVPS